MQLIRLLGVVVLCLFMPVAAKAQCTLALGTGGTLALSPDATVLGSQQLGGAAGTMTIVSIGSNTVTVSAPARISAPPAGYNAAQETVEVAYSGAGLLSFVSQGYTTQTTQFAVGTIGLSVLTLHNRIVNSGGFAPGSYTTRSVITCS